MKILIVEDDEDISEFIKIGFQADGFAVDTAPDGTRGAFMARTNVYDIIILDNSLPGKSGLEICEDIRSRGSHIPIIFLSVIGDTKKKIEAFAKGADDYVTKPFSFEEMKARVKALLRRPRKIENALITIGDLSLDTEKRTVSRGGVEIHITKKEFSLLEYLMRNPDIAVSRSMIMEHVWNAEKSDPFSNTVEAHILNLRKKLNAGDRPDIIRNITGRGYIIDPQS